jgi:glucose/arabinose dehydrogenase
MGWFKDKRARRWQALVVAGFVLCAGLAFMAVTSPVGAVGKAAWPTIKLTLISDDFSQPLQLLHAGDGSGRLFVVERAGYVRIVKNGALLTTPFLDIHDRVNSTCGECGLLSIAFPPDFETSGWFVVSYSAKNNPVHPTDPNEPDPSVGNDTVLARFRVTGNPDVADPSSEQPILLVNQPYANHNGGLAKFGPDGKLYFGLGDGGSGGDPLGAGQRLNTLLGKLLRIAVGPTGTYTVPSDNPFVGVSGARPEIWAYGLRNPWRWSFDRTIGDLWIGDVGQGLWEEVDFAPSTSTGGENYGWNRLEGTHCYEPPTCTSAGTVLPVHEYPHGNLTGRSVTGGYVYRGPQTGLQGIYFFSDISGGRIWGLRPSGSVWEWAQFLETGRGISSFGEDEAGQLYVTSYYDGALLRIDEAPPPPTSTPTTTPTPTHTGTPINLTPSATPTVTSAATPPATPSGDFKFRLPWVETGP